MEQLYNGILWTHEENPYLYLVIQNYAFSHIPLKDEHDAFLNTQVYTK